MNDRPTAAQKRWREAVRELGSIISGGPAVIHHPVGRKGKHNKVDVGHWWVIPLADDEHKGLHKGDDFILEGSTRKQFEKFWFSRVLMDLEGNPDFPSEEVVDAIMDYRR